VRPANGLDAHGDGSIVDVACPALIDWRSRSKGSGLHGTTDVRELRTMLESDVTRRDRGPG
jgi:hypothetical protein